MLADESMFGFRKEEAVKESAFGRDHWSLLVYVESRAVDHGGWLDVRHMRNDGDKYPTRLARGRLALKHNDWDCLDDLIRASYVVDKTGPIRLTEKGWKKAHALRKNKARTGSIYMERKDGSSRRKTPPTA